jgi:MoxR-like ATPase
VLSSAELLRLQEQAGQVTVDDSLVDYMLAIVEKTRSHESLSLGVSRRGPKPCFITPDLYQQSGGAFDPQSWNLDFIHARPKPDL